MGPFGIFCIALKHEKVHRFEDISCSSLNGMTEVKDVKVPCAGFSGAVPGNGDNQFLGPTAQAMIINSPAARKRRDEQDSDIPSVITTHERLLNNRIVFVLQRTVSSILQKIHKSTVDD